MTTKLIYTAVFLTATLSTHGQQVNDSNTPLHLMQPQYKSSYGVSTPQQVKEKMDLENIK